MCALVNYQSITTRTMTKAIKFIQGDKLHVAHSRHMNSFLNCPSHTPRYFTIYTRYISSMSKTVKPSYLLALEYAEKVVVKERMFGYM